MQIMSESKIRGRILVELWISGKPISIQELSNKIGLNSSSIMQFLMELINAKYVSVFPNDSYKITAMGKKVIGFPKIDKDIAQNILESVSLERSFHFYYDIDQYSGIYAVGLEDFIDKINVISLKSIEFHVPRRDFEFWIRSLGDLELSKKLGILRTKNLTGENLRDNLYLIVKTRYEELVKLLE